MNRHKIATFLATLGLLIGGATVVVQFFNTITLRMANGYSLGASVLYFISFLTILTNTGVFLTYASALFPRARLGWFRKPNTRAMFAVLILVVMVVYHLLLSNREIPDLLSVVLDKFLHYVAPILFLIWWATHPRADAASFTRLPMMLMPPALYLLWVFTRGAVIGEYPYPFLDLTQKSLATVVTNLSVIVGASLILFAVAIWLDRRLAT